MRILSPLLVVLGASLVSTGCVSTYRTAQISDAGVGGSVKYKVIGKVEGNGQVSVISPAFSPYFVMQGLEEADQKAIGEAIYERDDVDAVIAPKRERSFSNFLLIGFAKVKLRGVGVQILPDKE